MNYTLLNQPSQIVCDRCKNVQLADTSHCSSCGLSFTWGQNNKYVTDTTISTSNTISFTLTPIPNEDIDRRVDKNISNMARRKADKIKYTLKRICEEEA